MKKIVSALIVLTMIFAFANLTSAADIKSYDLTYKILDSSRNEIADISALTVDDKFYVEFYMSAYPKNMTTFGAELLFDMDAFAYDNNRSSNQVIGEEENDDGEMEAVKFTFSVANRAANDGIALTKIGTDKWNTDDFSFAASKYFARLRFVVKGDCAGKTLEVKSWSLSDGMGDGYVANENPIVTLMAAGSDEPTGPATIVPTAAALTDVIDAEYWQKGQAVSMTFAAADIKSFADMSWELACEKKGTVYAPVDFPVATIAALGDTAPVQFVAAFLVNSEEDPDGDKINTISAGFCDAEKNLVAQTAATAISAVPAE